MTSWFPRLGPQKRGPGSNNLVRILAELGQNGNLVQKSSTSDAASIARCVRVDEEGIEDGVQGTHGVLRIFVIAHLVFIPICATCGTHHSRRIQPFLERRISNPTRLTADVIATATAT